MVEAVVVSVEPVNSSVAVGPPGPFAWPPNASADVDTPQPPRILLPRAIDEEVSKAVPFHIIVVEGEVDPPKITVDV